MRKPLALLLSLCMILTALVFTPAATAADISASTAAVGASTPGEMYADNLYEYSLVTSKTIKIIGYEGSRSALTIPSKIDGRTVVSIGDWAFYSNKAIKSVVVPDTVKSIGAGAFDYCSNLKTVKLPKSVTSLGSSAFEGCVNLTEINIPNTVTSIGDGCFYECKKLKAVTLPKSVKTIGNRAFLGCSSLTSVFVPKSVTKIGTNVFSSCSKLKSITVDKNNKYYDSRKNCSAIIETKSNKLVQGCNNTVIPSDIKIIGAASLEGCGFTSIKIPSGVKTIENGAFSNCAKLKSISIPDSVKTIDFNAFFCCSSLTSVKMPKNITKISNGLFTGCANLKSVKIPSGVKTIGDFAFSDCKKLSKLDLGNTVTTIAYGAFYNCADIGEVTLPGTVKKIGPNVFAYCSSIKSITIPASVSEISQAFKGCTSLVNIKVDDKNKYYDSRDNCNAIINRSNNTLITGCKKTVIPDTTKAIASGAFYDCSGLKSIVIPSSVTTIGMHAFYNCSGLKSIDLPEGLTTIGMVAFYGCKNLKSVKIPKSIKKISMLNICGLAQYNDADWHYYSVRGFTVIGAKGSVAEKFAKDKGYKFIVMKSTPEVSKAENVASGVQVSWGKVKGAAKYRLLRKTGSGKWIKIADTTKLSYTDKTAKSGTKYSYAVKCVTKDGNSYTSYKSNNKTITYIAAPKNPALKNTKSGVQVKWSKVRGAAKYRVFRRTLKGSWQKLTDTASLSYVDKSAKSGATYYYTIRCISKNGKSYTSSYNSGSKIILISNKR